MQLNLLPILVRPIRPKLWAGMGMNMGLGIFAKSRRNSFVHNTDFEEVGLYFVWCIIGVLTIVFGI